MSGSGRRIARVNEQLKREVSRILRDEVKDPRVNPPPTVTGVETASDLGYAKVWVQTLGGEEAREEVLEGLRAAGSFIRGELGRRLHLRKVPELDFRIAPTLEKARRIESILAEVRTEDAGADPDAAVEESEPGEVSPETEA